MKKAQQQTGHDKLLAPPKSSSLAEGGQRDTKLLACF